MAVPNSPAREPKIHYPNTPPPPPPTSATLQWAFTVINHSCLPGFHQDTVHSACVQVFLSQACNWVLKLQILGTPAAQTSTVLPREGLAMLLPFAGPIPGRQSCYHTAVHSLWQHRAECCHLDSMFSARFLTLMPGNPAHLHTTHSSDDSGDPQTMLPYLGFHLYFAT